MPTPPITRALLDGFLGRNIKDICTEVRLVDNNLNHCAHFVNHVLGFDHPLTCGGLRGRPGAAANIRVHETFAKCPEVGDFANRPNEEPRLAFVTLSSAVNLATKTMANIPKKHVGIFCEGDVWHYSNTADKVVRQSAATFAGHYSGAGFGMFYGSFPATSRAVVASVTTHAAAPELSRGQKDSSDVATWQQFLILRNLLFGKPVRQLLDGDFGPMTEEATEAFQLSAGINVDGKVDAVTNNAAIGLGFIPRTSARQRTAITSVTPEISHAATDALESLGPTRVFYTEELIDVGGQHLVARLEPHKHMTGTVLRYWHRGITVYPA